MPRHTLPNVFNLHVCPFHSSINNQVTQAHAKIALTKSGKIAKHVVAQPVEILGPQISANQKSRCGDVCKALRPYLPNGYVVSSQAVQKILRAIIREVKKLEYRLPVKLNHFHQLFVFDQDIVVSSNVNCAATLNQLLATKYFDTTWIVQKFMTALKADDPFFDYRIHFDDNNEVDCVVWQTGKSRGALEKYSDGDHADMRVDNFAQLSMVDLKLKMV